MGYATRSRPAKPVFLPCIMGPTGAGKTAAALALASAFDASVINADSRQVYKDFPIITAQPSAEEQSACPHLLYGFLGCEQKLGAGAYARAAGRSIDAETQKGRLPLLVGGTGLYFKALLSGIAPIPPVPPDIAARWQRRCEEEGGAALHALLTKVDPAYAGKIHPHDRQRLTRALAVWEATGKTFSWWHDRELPGTPYLACKIGIGLPLAQLEGPLAGRIDLMLEAGALEEARTALNVCPDPAAPGWSGIGCAELYRHLAREISLEECKALWLKNTRAYAKRQHTWFRADPDIRWFAPWQISDIVEHVRQARRIAGQR